MSIKIGNKVVGTNEKIYFIADIASNHDGDIDRAFKLIELAKDAGADAAKFQNFHAKTIVSDKGFKSMSGTLSHQKSWSKSVFEVYEDASVPDDWNEKLKTHCDSVGIEYMTSPYDFDAVDAVTPLVNAFKIGSGDITWTGIIEHISKKGKPVLLATGASDIADVDRAVKTVYKYNQELVLMQCNTNYTADEENFNYINLNVLLDYKSRYPDVTLGLSDHTPGHATVLGAIALGARVIEKHFTDDNNRVGPDHKFSMNPVSWREMVDESNRLHKALGDGTKRIEENEKDTVMVQRRSLYYSRSINEGEVITLDDVVPLRPVKNDGFLPYQVNEIIGKTLSRDCEEGDYAKLEDFI